MSGSGVMQDDLKNFIAEEVRKAVGPTISEILLLGAGEGGRRGVVSAVFILLGQALARAVADYQRHCRMIFLLQS